MLIVFSLAAIAALAGAQVSASPEGDVSKVIVQGWATVKSAPTIARISYDVRGEGSTSDAAVRALAVKSAAVVSALRSMDPSIEINSDTVRVQAVRPRDCAERDYDETVHLSTGECAIKGFVAVQDYNLRTNRVNDAGTIVGLAGRRGAYNPKIESFALADEKSAKQRAIANAMADAREKAAAVAAGSAARLGDIISVSLDNARERSSEIVVTGSRNPAVAAERDEPIAISLTPSPVETAAQVTVAFAIIR